MYIISYFICSSDFVNNVMTKMLKILTWKYFDCHVKAFNHHQQIKNDKSVISGCWVSLSRILWKHNDDFQSIVLYFNKSSKFLMQIVEEFVDWIFSFELQLWYSMMNLWLTSSHWERSWNAENIPHLQMFPLILRT